MRMKEKSKREANGRGQDSSYRGKRRGCSATSGGKWATTVEGLDGLGFDGTTIAATGMTVRVKEKG
jgi:hypothetical protein